MKREVVIVLYGHALKEHLHWVNVFTDALRRARLPMSANCRQFPAYSTAYSTAMKRTRMTPFCNISNTGGVS